jgi:hypothetical protein
MEEHILLAAVLEARLENADDDGAMTVKEIAKETNLSIARTRLFLADLQEEDKIDVVWTKRPTITTPLTGTMLRVPGYVFKGT